MLRHSHLPRPLAFPLPALSLTLALPLLLLAPLLLVKALLLLQLLLALRQLVLGLTLKLLQRLVQHHEGIVRVGTGGGIVGGLITVPGAEVTLDAVLELIGHGAPVTAFLNPRLPRQPLLLLLRDPLHIATVCAGVGQGLARGIVVDQRPGRRQAAVGASEVTGIRAGVNLGDGRLEVLPVQLVQLIQHVQLFQHPGHVARLSR